MAQLISIVVYVVGAAIGAALVAVIVGIIVGAIIWVFLEPRADMSTCIRRTFLVAFALFFVAALVRPLLSL